MSTCEETFHETTSRRISRISQRTKRTADGIWAFVLGVLFGSIVDLTRVGHQDVAVSILVRRPCTQLSLLITSEYATPIHARENALLRTRASHEVQDGYFYHFITLKALESPSARVPEANRQNRPPEFAKIFYVCTHSCMRTL